MTEVVPQAGSRSPDGSPTGRTTESARLREEADLARAGRGRLVIVRGPSGIGKSALLDGVPGDGFTVLRVTCRETDSATAYAAASELLRTPADLQPRAREQLAAALSAATPLTGAYPTLRRLERCVALLAAHRPLALVVDDAHWCDASSLRWLRFLLTRSRHRPLLVLAASRDRATPPDGDELEQLTAWHASAVLGLGPLDPATVADVVGQRLGTPEPQFAQECARLSGGNPRLLHQLLDALSNAGVQPRAGEAERVVERGRATVRASLRTRLAMLPQPVRNVLAALAVAGDIGPALVGAMARVSAGRARTALAVLREEGIVTPDGSGFVHETIRQAVIDTLPPREQTQLCERAVALLNDTAQPVRQVAEQLLRLPRLECAWMADALHTAADEAMHQGEPMESVRYLRRLLADQCDPAERERTRIRLAETLMRLDPAAALPDLLAAVRRAATPVEQARLAIRYGDAAIATQRVLTAEPVLAAALEALRTATGGRPSPEEAELECRLRSTLVVIGISRAPDSRSGRARVQESATALRTTRQPAGDTLEERRILAAQALLTAVESRSAPAAVTLAQRALTSAVWDDWISHQSSWVLALADEVELSSQVFEQALDVSRDQGNDWVHHQHLALRGLTLYLRGAIHEGLAEARRALELDERASWRRSSTLPPSVMAVLLTAAGRPEAADKLLARRGIIEGADTPDGELGWARCLLSMYWGWSRWRRGDRAGALRTFLRTGDELRASGVVNPVISPWWMYAVKLLVKDGRAPEARELIEQVATPAANWGTPRALGQVLLARAAAADQRKSIGLYLEAADVLAGAPDLASRIQVDYQLGRALLQAGDPAAARKHLRQAVDLATRTGAHGSAGAAAELLVMAGGRLRKATDGPASLLLTRSELQIAELAMRGVSNQRIADELFITLRTVETHLTATYRKLGVSNRRELSQILPRWRHGQDAPRAEGGAGGPAVRVARGSAGSR
ncbi:helix-turn-helix transcriptional regulator [Streptomyces capitiformicae]|uniref:Transcriptional regulator n=1 Tax=Streptomyces capitiformicae TaxID=2014920 RepID=A0A919DHH3_9ACTN|nr:LuxR family transcriptional regulator [Streptomyces capitiformicae]GHE48269.1 transcriptional regulator [Streptomyces capitiformicae]